MRKDNKPCWVCFARGWQQCISVSGVPLATNHDNRGLAAPFEKIPVLTMPQRIQLMKAVRRRQRGAGGLTLDEIVKLANEIISEDGDAAA